MLDRVFLILFILDVLMMEIILVQSWVWVSEFLLNIINYTGVIL